MKKDYFFSIKQMESKLTGHGWVKQDAGHTQTIDFNKRFDIYVRTRNMYDVLKQNGVYQEKTPIRQNEKPLKSTFESIVSDKGNATETSLTAPVTPNINQFNSELLPVLSKFSMYESLSSLQNNCADSLVIAYDSEWVKCVGWDYIDILKGDKRDILTWQFAVIYQKNLYEFVFVRMRDEYLLPIDYALGYILKFIGFSSYDERSMYLYESLKKVFNNGEEKIEIEKYKTKQEAVDNADIPYESEKMYKRIINKENINYLPVTLVCHAAKFDLSALQRKDVINEILKRCIEVQGGLVTNIPIITFPLDPLNNSTSHPRKFAVKLNIRDTMCHAPAKSKSLESIGKALGFQKIDIPIETKSHMDEFLINCPAEYMEYSSTDSVVTLLYCSTLYGYNRTPPITLTSATAKIAQQFIAEYLYCTSKSEFERMYRGVQRVVKGTEQLDNNRIHQITNLEACSHSADFVQLLAAKSYSGGYNDCSGVNYINYCTYDYDVKNAYASAMYFVPDIDWSNPINKIFEEGYILTLDDFKDTDFDLNYNPCIPMLACVQFDFPKSVKYPCIPQKIDGVPIYLPSSEDNEVYASGPELYLALKLGAKITVKSGVICNKLHINGEISYSLRSHMKYLIQERDMAKSIGGKDCLEDLILKNMITSIYGKVAQNVINKKTYDAYNEEMKAISDSLITNPVSATLITSIIRSVLFAARNQCIAETNKSIYCVTTDGFISDLTLEELNSFDLFGFSELFKQARLYYTNNMDSTFWDIKHAQDDLLVLTTRGNVSLYSSNNKFMNQYEGVCAHNSYKTGYVPDSDEDRLAFYVSCLERTAKMKYEKIAYTSFRELSKGAEFRQKITPVDIRMDYDLKRKPIRESFRTEHIVVNGVEYELACFDTIPYNSSEEYKLYRKTMQSCEVLRTQNDWNKFFAKIDSQTHGVQKRIKDLDWSILFNCIVGHRGGYWNIPMLDILKGQARIEWINQFNNSNKNFTANDWKNAGRADRISNCMPEHALQPLLSQMISNQL